MTAADRGYLYHLGEQLIARRKPVLLGVTVVTLIFAAFALRLNLVSRFDEQLPQNHPFIQVYSQYAPTFGSANTIMLMLEVKEGTIFTQETLGKIFGMTQLLDRVHGVNHELVNSIAHRTNRRVRMMSGGFQVVEPVMEHAPKNADEVELVRRIVHTSRNLYGVL
ncbi:MAG: transporter, partial [Deltaproteobacteria bacterium]|nr:transporter [Deltaproteobacteria bacterium]